jgi:YHS domain-containing protein
MADTSNLLNRINAEFAALDAKIKKSLSENVEAYRDRQKRLGAFEKALDDLRGLWRPKLEALAKRFGDQVKLTPRLTPSSREVVFAFQSPLAQIRLKFSAYADKDLRNLVLAYDLDIVPILIHFDSHAETTCALDAINKDALDRWLDDQIVAFVRTYLSLHEDERYLKEEMVEDPVAHIRFPKFAAANTFKRNGTTLYFISEETRCEFDKLQPAAQK